MTFQPPPHLPRAFGAKRRVLVVLACVLGAVAVIASVTGSGARADSSPPDAAAFVVIVNPSNAVTTLDRSFVERAFLKKLRWWPDGVPIQPVDLPPAFAVRRRWSQDILARSVEAVKSYWQQLIFAGRDLPPPEMESEAAAVDYVLHAVGGVGYVSPGTKLRGAKVLSVQ